MSGEQLGLEWGGVEPEPGEPGVSGIADPGTADPGTAEPGQSGLEPLLPLTDRQPLSILIAALGGEGGGVLVDWLVSCATRAGLAVQATSVPGVAQRTGATSYYFECLRQPIPAGRRPVFALMPVPGRVDVLLASELLEAVRMIERGFVTPTRTVMIAARHRVLTTAEKMKMADGRYDDERLHDAARTLSRQYLSLDLRGLAERNKTVISAVMFGALAGSGVLPWSRQICEEAIHAGGIGVEASLAGFDAAWKGAAAEVAALEGESADGDGGNRLAGLSPIAAADEYAAVVAQGEARATDYQDAAYAARYRARADALVVSAGNTAGVGPALVEAARQLVLWMTYEDMIRVADLKTRPERFSRIRVEAGAAPGDVLEIREHFSPSLAELAAIAPRRLGRLLQARVDESVVVGARGQGRTLASTGLTGYALLRVLSRLRRWRPRSLRYADEQAAIEDWLAALRATLASHPGFARALAELPRLRKGYSDTWTRGVANYERIFAALVAPVVARRTAPVDDDAAALRTAIDAALADPERRALDAALTTQQQKGPPEEGAPVDFESLALARPIHFQPGPAGGRPRREVRPAGLPPLRPGSDGGPPERTPGGR